ncbi:MAG: YceH family protein [Undibacterium sp.]|uniref:YceH family protein n=1 Tax=Undibacterium sp. TaxID=1914977 RepID=UPI002722A0AA|nr:YceH family protein [Undibacterium sp.]MDO8653737.1 YceH family protein [Undibacterium sp.]
MNTENTNTNSASVDTPAENTHLLDAFEVRVLAVLAEKEATTPDNYPMSLNALVNGCNQLSNRDPVMSLSENTALEVLDRLAQKKLVGIINQAGARVAKYEHRMRIKWMLEQDKLAVLTTLMLRGFQTVGEIRSRCARLHEFTSVAEVETSLAFLMDKYPSFVARLARAPGTKEPRYAHLLSGEEILEQQEVAAAFSAKVSGSSERDRITQLEQEVAGLREELSVLTQQFTQFQKQFE